MGVMLDRVTVQGDTGTQLVGCIFENEIRTYFGWGGARTRERWRCWAYSSSSSDPAAEPRPRNDHPPREEPRDISLAAVADLPHHNIPPHLSCFPEHRVKSRTLAAVADLMQQKHPTSLATHGSYLEPCGCGDVSPDLPRPDQLPPWYKPGWPGSVDLRSWIS